jgi:hypothetical protein
MAVFGKRPAPQQTIETKAPAAPPPPNFRTPSSGRLVFIRASAVEAARSGAEPYELVQALVDFMNFATHQAHYMRTELDPKVMQAYHADYYLAQVNNGGHSQFIGNSSSILDLANADIQAALTAMGSPHANIHQDMMRWIASNKDEANTQNGFENRSAYLDELDDRFYDVSKTDDMIAFSARWILTWPELTPVADAEYAARLDAFATANTRRGERLIFKQIVDLMEKSMDHLRVSIGLALTSLKPPELMTGIGGGAYQDIEGQQELVFHVQSNAGTRKAAVRGGACRIYEYNDPDGERMRTIQAQEGLEAGWKFHNSPEYRKPWIGARIAEVDTETVVKALQVSKDSKAAPAIGLMLAKLGLAGQTADISAMPPFTMQDGTECIRWLVGCRDQLLMIDTSYRGAAMVVMSEGNRRVTASFDEIATYEADYSKESMM